MAGQLIKYKGPKKRDTNSPVPVAFEVLDGSPYADCGWCEIPVRLVDAHRQKITILIKWDEVEDFVFDPVKMVVRQIIKRVPVLTQKPGCFNCWNHQQREKAILGTHFYGLPEDNRSTGTKLIMREVLAPTTTRYAPKAEYNVVHNGAVNTYQQRTAEEFKRDSDGRTTNGKQLYGPYQDRRKGKK